MDLCNVCEAHNLTVPITYSKKQRVECLTNHIVSLEFNVEEKENEQ